MGKGGTTEAERKRKTREENTERKKRREGNEMSAGHLTFP